MTIEECGDYMLIYVACFKKRGLITGALKNVDIKTFFILKGLYQNESLQSIVYWWNISHRLQ